MSYQYFDELPGEAKERYLEKLNAVKLKECPYRLPAGCWSSDLATWPNLEYPDIYEYLVETPGKTLLLYSFTNIILTLKLKFNLSAYFLLALTNFQKRNRPNFQIFFPPGPYTRESIKSRKGLEPYNQFQSGWVQKVLSLNTTEDTCVLIAKVLHSQRLAENPLRPWVALKKDGTVICAHCNCMAGYEDINNFVKPLKLCFDS